MHLKVLLFVEHRKVAQHLQNMQIFLQKPIKQTISDRNRPVFTRENGAICRRLYLNAMLVSDRHWHRKTECCILGVLHIRTQPSLRTHWRSSESRQSENRI